MCYCGMKYNIEIQVLNIRGERYRIQNPRLLFGSIIWLLSFTNMVNDKFFPGLISRNPL